LKTKKCSKCKETKPIIDFYKHKDYKHGIRSECKECTDKKNREYYKNNAEKINEYQRYYHKKHYKNNLEKEKNRKREYYINNKEKVIAQKNKWKQNNPEKVREIYKKSNKKRQLISTIHLNNIISSLVRRSLKNGKGGNRLNNLLGYTLQDLMAHLESLFKDGMTWDNYGKWHIDHIRPVSSFNFSSYDDPEFKECWALNNLQPLWAEDNIKKSNKIMKGVNL
jgi:hypothetical protein